MRTLSSISVFALVLFGGISIGLSQFSLLSVGQIKNGGTASDLAVSGHFVYLANLSDGLRIYDVSDPSNPVNIFHTNNAGATAADVFVSGQYAYLANIGDGLRIYDVSNPSNAVEVAHVLTNGSLTSVTVTNGYAYVAGDISFEIVNVTNPASPSLVSEIAVPTGLDQLDVSGKYLFLAGNPQGLIIYDASDLTSPIRSGQIYNKNPPLWVTVSGNFAYVANGNDGFRIYSITNPASPVNVGHAPGYGDGVAVTGQYAFVAGSGIAVYDVSNPSQPVLVGSANTGAAAYGVEVSGDYIYVANSTGGLKILRLMPQVRIAINQPQNLTLTWPTTVAPFALEQNADIGTTNWVAVTNSPSVQGLKYQIILPRTAPGQFFRLREQ